MIKNLPYSRAERVAHGVKRLIVEAILTEVSDPRLESVNITRVILTKDLKIARVYFYLLEKTDELEDRTKRGLNSAKGFFKKRIARELNLKYTPDIQFFYDESIDLCEKIDSLFGEREST
ncbi:MAG: 30S ribosome-binding factor RbfA [Deltaproteobacteria bacterium]|jgi:ribosome-binding factor A|nr:30S ribosome-binding factor RbfA [Deltaproteobacteria bacterium]